MLSRAGLKPWKDSEDIPWGERWKSEIRKAIHECDLVAVLVSSSLVGKRRYFQIEINEALAEAKKRGPKRFIVPVKLNNCKIPKKLNGLQATDLIKPSDWPKLVQYLKDETGQISEDENREIPQSLMTRPFAYGEPEWLTMSQRKRLSEVAKAAFVLLLFEQTETGCWGKSYLPRYLPKLLLAMGAITGTPFALLAISSYADRKKPETRTFGRTEQIVQNLTDRVLATLDELLQADGSYRRERKGSFTGSRYRREDARHEAAAGLIRMLYGEIGDRDLKTLQRLCKGIEDPQTYDFAVVSRALFQVSYVDSVPSQLNLRAASSYKRLLAELVRDIESADFGNIARVKSENSSSIEQWSTAQWSTAWYVLPFLTLSSIPSELPSRARDVLIKQVSRFFSERSAASASGVSLLPTQVVGPFSGDGKSAFGTGLGLVAWRMLEEMAPANKTASQHAQKMVDRIVHSTTDVIETPMSNPSPEKPEGYLGWGAVCLGAASVGIRISYDDCHAAITLTKKLNDEPVDSRSEKELEKAYIRIIKKNNFLKPEIAGHVARAAARLSFIYEPVRRAKKEAIDSRA
jgi:hypothetical protein